MGALLKRKEVGPWPMNTYLVTCEKTRKSAIIDPGADGDVILALAEGTKVEKILITHGHEDHIGALEEVKGATGATVFINEADGIKFNISHDAPLVDGMEIQLGNISIGTFHTPGHTPGMTCFSIGENRIIVGDTIFIGGPGKTWSAEEFTTTMRTMKDIVFRWSDNTIFYPGHGANGRIGDERQDYEAFVGRGWQPGLFGDITWK